MGNCRSTGVVNGGARGRASIEDVRSVDLLLVLTKAAATSSRAKTILGPFPKPCTSFGSNDYDKAAAVAGMMPRARSLMVENETCKPPNPDAESKEDATAACEKTSKISSRKSRKTSFEMAHWALRKAPAKIIPLEGARLLAGMSTPFQFILKHKNQSREVAFRKARNRGKTTLAFHGSHIENWHSILHNGLMVCSGKTGFQLNGAAYGSGIYVSPYASTSMGYCGNTWKYRGMSNPQAGVGRASDRYKAAHTLLSDDAINGIRVLALCEIKGEVKKPCSSIWVVPKAHQIAVRALFVYTSGTGSSSITANTLRHGLLQAAKKHKV